MPNQYVAGALYYQIERSGKIGVMKIIAKGYADYETLCGQYKSLSVQVVLWHGMLWRKAWRDEGFKPITKEELALLRLNITTDTGTSL